MKNKIFKIVAASLSLALIFSAVPTVFVNASEDVSVYRLYNPKSGEHLYSVSKSERDNLIASKAWNDEGISWTGSGNGSSVYRVYNQNSGEHHYTLDLVEKNELIKKGWKDEGVAWKSSSSKNYPVYRLFNSKATSSVSSHHYTMDVAERNTLLSRGWSDEGIAWYSNSNNTSAPAPQPQPQPQSQPQTPVIDTNQAFCDEVIRLVNVERTKLGLDPLKKNETIMKAASIRAKELVQLFEHKRPNGTKPYTALEELGLDYNIAGENIAYNYNTPEDVMRGWMNSPGHKGNILDSDFNSIGVGIYSENGRSIYAVQLFAKVR